MAVSVLCTLATYNHLHQVLALLRSAARHWPEEPRAVVLLVDGHEKPRPGFESLDWVRFVSPADLGVENLAWLAAKYSATDLCCALKPILVRHLLRAGEAAVLYADSDQLFLADPAPLLDYAPEAEIVLTPHLLTPLPDEQPFLRPSMGDLAGAGMMNAGLFVARQGSDAMRFLDSWVRLVTAPGAFLADLGPQHEQNSFNWALALMERVAVCRDPRLNIAYWNLHERPLRWAALDGGAEDRWLLEGQAPVCVHFSGFAWGEGRFSRYDQRHLPALNINLRALGDYYDRCLRDAGQEHYAGRAYAYTACGGLALDPAVRTELRRAERFGTPRWDAWPQDPRVLLAPLLSAPGESALLPDCLNRLYDARSDLRADNGDDVLHPLRFLTWCERRLAIEYPALGTALAAADCWLVERASGRRLLVGNPASGLRRLFAEDTMLRQSFPQPLEADRAALQAAVATLSERWVLPAAVLAFAGRFDPGGSLARVAAYLRLVPALQRRLRSEGFGRQFLMTLLPYARGSLLFNAADVALLDWWLEERALRQGGAPSRRLYATLRRHPRLLRLARGLGRRAATRAALAPLANGIAVAGARARGARDHGLDEALLPYMADFDRPAARRAYLAWWCGQRGLPTTALAQAEALLAGQAPAGLLPPGLAPAPRGVNLFGHFRSPIGLASMASGLASALQQADYTVTRQVLANQSMAPDLALADLYPDFDFGAARNIAVGYPHRQYDLDEIFPHAFFQGRETVGYLAWEQRDLHPAWVQRLARYDRLWGLSGFTAEAIARATGRPCATVPCVVEVDVARARGFGRRHFDLPEDRFIAGCVIDAGSGVERKNPQGTAQALLRAFGGRRDVLVVIKVNGGERPAHAALLRDLRQAFADARLELRLLTAVLPRAEIEGLMACFDLYISLHRAEGFGYTLAEAMALAVPVVATGYSGNLDFMTADNSALVPWQETLVRRAEGPFQIGTVWAEPDVAAAAALCDWLYRDRAAANRLAAQGAADVGRLLSAAALAERLPALLA